MNRDDEDTSLVPAPACPVCRDPLADDGTCSYCGTEACEACGEVIAPNTLVPVTEYGVTLRVCPACIPASLTCACGAADVPTTNVPPPGALEGSPCCDDCARELVREAAFEEMIDEHPMTSFEGLRWGVEMALGGVEVGEDETCEIVPESNAELVYGRRTEAA